VSCTVRKYDTLSLQSSNMVFTSMRDRLSYTEVNTPSVLLAKPLHIDDRIPTILFSEA
jgi:hypothetical protein